MYSYEQRRVAIELCCRYDGRAAAAVRALGYPSVKQLKRWHLHYLRTGEIPEQKQRQSRYTDNQKARAVRHYFETGQCLAHTKRSLGYPNLDLLRSWIDAVADQKTGPQPTTGRAVPFSHTEKQQAVIQLGSRDGSAAAVAERIGVSRCTLYKWRDQLLDEKAKPTLKKSTDKPASGEADALRAEVKALEKRVHELQLEHDILVKASELVKKANGVNPRTLSNREKTRLVDALQETYRLQELLTAVNLPRSSYYYHREALRRPDKYAEARQAIARIFDNNYRCYGYRRIGQSLRQYGTPLSEKVVRRLMTEEGLVVGSASRRRFSTYRGEISPAPENIIARDFQSPAPNEKWLTDITEFPVPDGKVYLSPMIDCFDGLVVSWSISASPNAELVNAMLDEAISTLAPGERPVVHSDRGCHYRWPGWLERLEAAELTRSMSRKGCTPDNAACEAFFGRLKVEFFYARQWTGTTMEQFVAELDAYIRWYNESRIKMSLGGRSPIEYSQNLGIAA